MKDEKKLRTFIILMSSQMDLQYSKGDIEEMMDIWRIVLGAAITNKFNPGDL